MGRPEEELKIRKGWTWDYFEDDEHIRVESPEGHAMRIPACVPVFTPFEKPHKFVDGACVQCGAPEDENAGWPMVTLGDLIQPDDSLKVENYGGIDRIGLVLEETESYADGIARTMSAWADDLGKPGHPFAGREMAMAAGRCTGVPSKDPAAVAAAKDRFDEAAREINSLLMQNILEEELRQADLLDPAPLIRRVPRWKRIIRSPAALVATYRLLHKGKTRRMPALRAAWGLTAIMVRADRNPFEKPNQPTTLEGTEQ